MVDEQRPDPDALLESIKKAEDKEKRGKLKIFFGMCAGVGKTYAMLKAAHKKKAEGADIVVGYVETHKRAETDELTKNLEIIPRKKIEYKGVTFEEMDIDAILERCPQIAIVDELAHTNASGSRHPKRYHDVLELLDAGIDVYTTVNVQHLESRTDTVAQITGVIVRETVPDGIIDRAFEIEIIDISPDNLIKRLNEGKVYLGASAGRALDNFFTPANLTALREMALRMTAERVDHDLQDYKKASNKSDAWKSSDRLMVAIGPSPFSAQLIRWTRRMAYNMNASWIAVYIETTKELSESAKALLSQNISLANELGAEVISKFDQDIIQGLMRVARQRNVTQIVIGKPLRSWVSEVIRGGSLVDRLVRVSGNIDIYVVRGEKTEKRTAPGIIGNPKKKKSELVHYIIAISIVIATTFVNYLIADIIGYRSVALIFFSTIMAMALFFGRGPLFAASAISALIWDYFFIPPKFTFYISHIEDILMFLMYFIVATFTGNVTFRMRERERELRFSDERTMALYALVRDISGAANIGDILAAAVKQISEIFNADVLFFIKDRFGKISARPHASSTFEIDEKETGVAMWAFKNGKAAGMFTDTLPTAKAVYFPLHASGGTAGVVGLKFREGESMSFEQKALIETFANQISLSLEREMTNYQNARNDVLNHSKKFYQLILNLFSSEFKERIDTIKSILNYPFEDEKGNGLHEIKSYIIDVNEELETLSIDLKNLIEVINLKSGFLNYEREPHNVETLIKSVRKGLKRVRDENKIAREISSEAPEIMMDIKLLSKAIINIYDFVLENNVDLSKCRISVRSDNSEAIIYLMVDYHDNKLILLKNILENFSSSKNFSLDNVIFGLYLSTCIIEAHSGAVEAEINEKENVAAVIIRLPFMN